MPFIPAVNVCQAELVYTWSAQRCENVLHFLPDVPIEPGLMQELGGALVGWWNTNMDLLMPNTLTLDLVKLTDLTTENSAAFEYSTGLPLPGTTGQPSLPNNCALCITKVTLMRGRSFRGRIYHPGLQENQVLDNNVLATPRAAILAAWLQLLTQVTANASWEMVVVSRYSDNLPRTTAVITPVLSLNTDGVIDSQRRRLPGRGA